MNRSWRSHGKIFCKVCGNPDKPHRLLPHEQYRLLHTMTRIYASFSVFDVEGLSSCPLCPEAEVLDQCGDHVAVLSRHLLHLVDRAAARRLELAAVQLQPQKKV